MTPSSAKLLVVDDEKFNRDLLVRQLAKEGFSQIETAEDGRKGLELARANNFDLIFLDIEMPELDGHEVLEQIKADMRLRATPVIMISGVEDVEAVVRAIEKGAEDFLRKPFNPVILRARVNACLEKKRLADQEKKFLQSIREEKQKSERLLGVILPTAAAAELKASGVVKPRRFENIAVLFCDVMGFTKFCDSHGPEEVVARLQALFERFEDLTKKHGLEKIKTIGDAYMAIAGLHEAHAEPLLAAVKCGLEMGAQVAEVAPDWQVRTGVSFGSVVAGIVGREKYQFDVWGDTVNVASRMTGIGEPGTVAMTYEAWLQVESWCNGRSRGRVPVKGKGEVEVVECYGLR